MIKAIYDKFFFPFCLIISLILLLGLSSMKTYAIAPTEQIKLQKELTDLCIQYGSSCNVKFNNSPRVQAYTTPDGTILFTKGLLDKLSYSQSLSVGYHEVGHRVLNHFKRYSSYTWDNYPMNDVKEKTIRHQHEIEADMFATMIALNNNMSNALPDALKVITPNYYYNTTSVTHPSTKQRIYFMKKFENKFNYDWRLK